MKFRCASSPKPLTFRCAVIQKIRTGAQKDVKVGNFLNIMRECGYSVVLKKTISAFTHLIEPSEQRLVASMPRGRYSAEKKENVLRWLEENRPLNER